MTRIWAAVIAVGSLAPYQCTADPDPALAREESPGEALYRLATRFEHDGRRDARIETLREIISRYPSSRFAAAARDDLAKLGVSADRGRSDPAR